MFDFVQIWSFFHAAIIAQLLDFVEMAASLFDFQTRNEGADVLTENTSDGI